MLKIILLFLMTIKALFLLLDAYYFMTNKKKFDLCNNSPLTIKASTVNSIRGHLTFAFGLLYSVQSFLVLAYNIDVMFGTAFIALNSDMIEFDQLEMSKQSSIQYVFLIIKYYQINLLPIS